MLRKFKSLFILEDEKAASSAPKTGTTRVADSPTRTSEAQPRQALQVDPSKGQVNEKFIDILFDAMENNNIEGFDYMEFRQFLKSLDTVQMDEATKYRSAFATGRTMGATKENILQSADHYLDILKAEEQKFENAARSQKARVVDEKTADITRLEKGIAEKEQQIQKLTQEIDNARKEIREQTDEVAASEARITQTQSDFVHSYDLLVKQIQEDVQKIKSYLS